MHRARTDGDYIVVTDMALAEMMKSQQWESTTKRSLQILSEDPALVACSKAIGPLMKEEFDSGEPASSILDEEVSEKVRHLLGEVRNGDGSTLEHVRKVIQDARELGQRQHFDHTRNKAQLTQIVRSWKEDLSADDLRAVRRGDEERIRELLSNGEMQGTCINALVGAGYERSLAIRLTMDPSVTSHEFLTFVAIGLRWLDGIEGADEKKITNDLADKDYIVTAHILPRPGVRRNPRSGPVRTDERCYRAASQAIQRHRRAVRRASLRSWHLGTFVQRSQEPGILKPASAPSQDRRVQVPDRDLQERRLRAGHRTLCPRQFGRCVCARQRDWPATEWDAYHNAAGAAAVVDRFLRSVENRRQRSRERA